MNITSWVVLMAALFLAVMKISGVVDYSWIGVLSPIWGYCCYTVLFYMIAIYFEVFRRKH